MSNSINPRPNEFDRPPECDAGKNIKDLRDRIDACNGDYTVAEVVAAIDHLVAENKRLADMLEDCIR